MKRTTTSTGLPERKAMIRNLAESAKFGKTIQQLDNLEDLLRNAIALARDEIARRVKLRDAISQALSSRNETVAAAVLLTALADDSQ